MCLVYPALADRFFAISTDLEAHRSALGPLCSPGAEGAPACPLSGAPGHPGADLLPPPFLSSSSSLGTGALLTTRLPPPWPLRSHCPGCQCLLRLSAVLSHRRDEAGQKLTEFCQEKTLVTASSFFQQHKRWLYTWASPDGQYKTKISYILCTWRWRRTIQPAEIRLGADCSSDHQFLIANFRK